MKGLDSTLAAFAEPTRRRVVELLYERPRRPTEIASAIDMSAPPPAGTCAYCGVKA